MNGNQNGHQRLTGAYLFQLVHTATGGVEQMRSLTEAEARQFNASLERDGSPLRWLRYLPPSERPTLGG